MRIAATITLAALMLAACEFRADKVEFSFNPPAQDYTRPIIITKCAK